jgi:CheY-like chemotaxis protein
VRVLLVEDDTGDAERALAALRELALEAHWVKDGEEALEYVFGSGRYAGRDPRQAPEVVLLDIKMPKLDGFEVVERLKRSPARAIPVVVMASCREEREVLGAFHLEVAGYVVKPLEREALRTELARVKSPV